MEKQDVIKDVITYAVKKSVFSAENADCFILRGTIINEVSKEQTLFYCQRTQEIIFALAEQIKNIPTEGVLPVSECGVIFQYIFDRCVEIAYKLITDSDEINTNFNITEAFNYYELDIPEYLQLKVTNIVPRLANIFGNIYHYMSRKDNLSQDVAMWMSAIMMSAATLAFKFAMEIDLDDDAEMQDFLNN